MGISIKILDKWLSVDLPKEKRDAYIKMTKLRMEQAIFQFRGTFYKQAFGTSMGNTLPCFIANIIMSNLE